MFLCRSSCTASLPVRKGTKNETSVSDRQRVRRFSVGGRLRLEACLCRTISPMPQSPWLSPPPLRSAVKYPPTSKRPEASLPTRAPTSHPSSRTRRVNSGRCRRAGEAGPDDLRTRPSRAQLKLDQARAQLAEATSSVRQAQSRIGWTAAGRSTPRRCRKWQRRAPITNRLRHRQNWLPPMRSATPTWLPPATFPAAPTKKRAPSRKPRKLRPAARQQYEAASMRRARVTSDLHLPASLASVKAQLAQAERLWPTHHSRSLRRLHYVKAGGRGRIRGAYQQDRHHRGIGTLKLEFADSRTACLGRECWA